LARDGERAAGLGYATLLMPDVEADHHRATSTSVPKDLDAPQTHNDHDRRMLPADPIVITIGVVAGPGPGGCTLMSRPMDGKVKAQVAKIEAALKKAEAATSKARQARVKAAKAEETFEKESEE
jgi:hypothetical protein